ncbi:unnamed protein product [Spirodela intermedia]|uniref:Uncharacterized protein n=1 Tax=Spirodela intermedia TaxID=51605 RepID=A0A7I8K0C3_SPIIN|nr:unnamed protein product [Spirodela intermedia]
MRHHHSPLNPTRPCHPPTADPPGILPLFRVGRSFSPQL